MKTRLIFLIAGIAVSTLLNAQIKPVTKTRPQPQIKTIQNKEAESRQQVTKLYENTGPVVSNKVSPVSLLRKSASNSHPEFAVKIAQVEKNPVQIPNPYSSENGIVLNALTPSEPFTGSEMYVSGAKLDADLINKVKSGSATDIEMASTANQFDNVLYANFKNLPASNHLYLLTLAMHLSEGYYEVRMGKSFSNLEATPVSRFVYNPELQAYQLLLMIEPDSYNQYYVLVRSVIKSEHLTVMNRFYYIQLVQLD